MVGDGSWTLHGKYLSLGMKYKELISYLVDLELIGLMGLYLRDLRRACQVSHLKEG